MRCGALSRAIKTNDQPIYIGDRHRSQDSDGGVHFYLYESRL